MDYGFAHEGKVYTPNATPDIQPAENQDRNRAIEQAELAHWATSPDVLLAYYHFPQHEAPGPKYHAYREDFYPIRQRAYVSTWLGTRLGTIISAHVYRHNFGGRFISLEVLGTNGAIYHGRASYDWGQCVTLRKAKQQR